MACRICFEEGTDNRGLLSVCECSGSVGFVHKQCIKQWIIISKRKQCEICHAKWKNIDIAFLEPSECINTFVLCCGMGLSAIHALFLNYQLNQRTYDVISVLTITFISNAILVLLWVFLRNDDKTYRRIAPLLWICIFLPLSIGLELAGDHIAMAISAYSITISCHFVLAFVSLVPGPPNIQNIHE